MHAYLLITYRTMQNFPRNHAEFLCDVLILLCSQDVHWPSGAVGYFPSYSLGAMMATQIFESAAQEIPDLQGGIAKGDFAPLKVWLNDKVHSKVRAPNHSTMCTINCTVHCTPALYIVYCTVHTTQLVAQRQGALQAFVPKVTEDARM